MQNSAVRGAAWVVASAAAFMLANILVKHLGARLPPFEMALFRSAGGIVLVVAAWRSLLALSDLRDPYMHLIRSGVGVVSLVALVHSYTTLPIALVASFMYVRALLVIALARVFLGERADGPTWAATAVGIIGAMTAIWPRLMVVDTLPSTWNVLVLPVAALAGAGSHICMRRLAKTNPPSVVVAVSALLISAVVAVPASVDFIVPPIGDAAALAGMALFSGIAQWATVRGYAHASPAILAPLTLIDIPIALAAGFVAWGEVPSAQQAVGSALIVAASLFVSHRRNPESR